mmetsp:Transcript_5016/g.15836  ORF Transcript_5016/g.15836 Transcript_5016/m.15836 type:complete len:374 (-) Transcript_5016:215-1336(-)
MIADWFKPADPADAKKPAASSSGSADDGAAAAASSEKAAYAQKRREEEPEIRRELTDDELSERRAAAMRRKLAASATGGQSGHPGDNVTFEGMFRGLNALLMSENMGHFHDGIEVNTQRQMHNMLVASKLSVGSPQSAGWELTLQSNGFADVNAVTYTTSGRMSLMHQRMFKSGALGVLQFAAQPTPAGPQGNFFGMLQWPWMRNGTSQINYLKGQQVTLSHAAKILRGTCVGAQMTYDTMQRATSMSWGATLQRKNVNWFAQWTPDKGEWKVATTRHDWELDTEVFAMLEMANRKGNQGGEDLMSMISFGLKKPFIGGATVQACLQGFSRLKATLDLPFGGDREGLNRVNLRYCVQYDAVKGAAKQGISLTL